MARSEGLVADPCLGTPRPSLWTWQGETAWGSIGTAQIMEVNVLGLVEATSALVRAVCLKASDHPETRLADPFSSLAVVAAVCSEATLSWKSSHLQVAGCGITSHARAASRTVLRVSSSPS